MKPLTFLQSVADDSWLWSRHLVRWPGVSVGLARRVTGHSTAPGGWNRLLGRSRKRIRLMAPCRWLVLSEVERLQLLVAELLLEKKMLQDVAKTRTPRQLSNECDHG